MAAGIVRGGCLVVMSLFLAACSLPKHIQPDQLRDYKTDSCSLFPEGTINNPTLWEDCCIEHDFAYWKGGSEAKRRVADNTFEACVKSKQGNAVSPFIMWLGVRMGGSPYFPTPYRWGFGWPYLRGYKAITPEEQFAIDEISPRN